jgi:hypothetical protein
MNKWQIVCPVLAMLVFVMVVAVIAQRRMRRGVLTTQSLIIGHDLITATNSPHLARLSPFLRTQLSRLLGSPTRVATVLIGDEPGGSNTACSRIVLTNSAGQHLLIRLQHAGSPGMFEAVGFNTSPP